MKIKAAGELSLNDSPEQRDTFSFLFYFASPSRIKNISTISKGDQIYDKQWRETPAVIEFIYKNLRHGEYWIQAREYNKTSNDIYNTEKTAWSKLVGVTRRQVVWYMKVCLPQWKLIQSNLIKHLKEIHSV